MSDAPPTMLARATQEGTWAMLLADRYRSEPIKGFCDQSRLTRLAWLSSLNLSLAEEPEPLVWVSHNGTHRTKQWHRDQEEKQAAK